MKEVYTKPVLHMESFRLSQSIAAACSVPEYGTSTIGRANQWGRAECGWDMGNVVVWTDSNKGCSLKWPEDEPFDVYCYNNPNGGFSIFHS